MERSFILCAVFYACLISLPFTKGSESKEEFNCISCIEDALGILTFEAGYLAIDWVSNDSNTARSCNIRCRSRKYRFSGTKDNLCICGDQIKSDHTTATCDRNCPGDENEICGGEDSVSVCQTGFETTTTSTTTVTPSTSQSTTTVTPSPSQSTTTVTPSPSQSTTTLNASSNRTSNITKAVSTDASVTENSTSVKVITETSNTFLSSKAANIKGATSTTMTAIFISLPIAIVVGIIALILYLILRRRRVKTEPGVTECENPQNHESHNAENGINSETTNMLHCNEYELEPGTSICVEVATGSRKSDDKLDPEYSAVILDSGETFESNQHYGHIKTRQANSTSPRAIYSHLQDTKASPSSYPTENTYSHVGSNTSKENPEQFIDEAYNTCHSTQRTNKANAISEAHDDNDSVYDSTIAGGKHPVRNDISEYAHLNTCNEPVTKPEHTKADKKNDADRKDGGENEHDHHYFVLTPAKKDNMASCFDGQTLN